MTKITKEQYLARKETMPPSSPLAERILEESLRARIKQLNEEQKAREQELIRQAGEEKVTRLINAGCDRRDAIFLASRGLDGLYEITACDDTSISKETFAKVIHILMPQLLPFS